ncbi:MAG: Smr/MutS family protein [Pseudomonadota bacterium]
MKKRSSHELSGPEKALWNQVVRTVVPLPERKVPDMAQALRQADQALPAPLSSDQRRLDPVPTVPARSPFEAGDPRRQRQVARGKLAIDGVLDLHGMRQEEADRATAAFISRAAVRGHRVLLVITGKGSKESEHGRGILRKRFLQSIDAGLFGKDVASVRTAHQRHGGSGAFYVFLKAKKPAAAAKTARVTKASQARSKRGAKAS